MRLRDAEPDEIRRIVLGARSPAEVDPASDPGGDASATWRLALLDCPWSRERERFLVGLAASGRPLAGLRLTSLRGAFDGRPLRIALACRPVVFLDTAAGDEAIDLVDEALVEARRTGHDLAIRLAPAGEEPGARSGFLALPCSEAACRTLLPAPWPKEPAWLWAGQDPIGRVPGLREGGPDDMEALAAIHAEMIESQRLRIDRERGAWERILLARDLRRRLAGADDPFLVIEKEGRVAAYALLESGPPTLRWREHGALRGHEGLLTDLFWSALSRARRLGLQRIEGWFMPEALTIQPLYPTSDRRRRDNVVTLRALLPGAGEPVFAREAECRLWELDAT